MTSLRAAVATCAMALLAAAGPSLAQYKKPPAEPTVRSVQGTVTDDAGAVAGAVVHLKNTKTLQIRSYITKEDGSYAFHGLSRNVDYELNAETQNAESGTKALSVFDSRLTAVINLKLKPKK